MAIGERIRFMRNLRGMTQRPWDFLQKPQMFVWLNMSLAPELPKRIW